MKKLQLFKLKNTVGDLEVKKLALSQNSLGIVQLTTAELALVSGGFDISPELVFGTSALVILGGFISCATGIYCCIRPGLKPHADFEPIGAKNVPNIHYRCLGVGLLFLASALITVGGLACGFTIYDIFANNKK